MRLSGHLSPQPRLKPTPFPFGKPQMNPYPTYMKIGVDIDGVLIDTDTKGYLDFCREKLGWQTDYESFRKTHSWFVGTGQTNLSVMTKAMLRFISEVEGSQKPIEGAHKALKQLSEIADIYLITSRGGLIREVTEACLAQHLPDMPYKELSMDNTNKKTDSIITFGVDYYIDDSLWEISEILKNKSVATTIIPFPAFHGVPKWEEINDPRIHLLSIWKEIKDDTEATRYPELRQKAWKEIVEFIRQDTQE